MAEQEKIKSVLERVQALPPAEREAALVEACAGDTELAAEVRSLLAAMDAATQQGFLATPTVERPGDPSGDRPTGPPVFATEQLGAAIGPYKLLQRLGEGGFGTVFMAEQSKPIHRRVALKIIKLGMDSKAVIARFEAERQALALMDHPHIARVLDAGTTAAGQPYFVMDLVRGQPITDYADLHNLSVPERLDLFRQVCAAVQHAHQKGVIHRDLKPGNVLVGTEDSRPFAKVIDFGIAKAVGQRLTDMTLFTLHGGLMGTLEYMSPEQADASPDVDTRSDVYSLGVMLYELLTGVTPLGRDRLGRAALDELRRIIREEEPPRPSTRVTTAAAGADPQTLATIAKRRGGDPKRLGTLMRGELDWVVMRALEKERARRYGSPEALAEDLRRHAAGEPVEAVPPSTAYRLRKLVRRHRGKVAAAAAVLLALSIGLIGTATFAAKASRAAALADNEAAAARRDRGIALEASGRAQAQQAAAEWQSYTAAVRAAQIAIANDELGPARRLLDAAPVHLRGWEWNVLDNRSDESVWQLANGAGTNRRNVAVSSDGQLLATTTDEGKRVTLFGGNAWQPVRVATLEGEATAIGLDLSPDGRTVVVATDRDGDLLRFRDEWTEPDRLTTNDFADKVLLLPRSGHAITINEGINGREFIERHDFDARTSRRAFQEADEWLVEADADPSRRFVVTITADGTVRLWEAEAERLVGTRVSAADRYPIAAVAADGKRVAVASQQRTVRVITFGDTKRADQSFDAATGESIKACALTSGPRPKLIVGYFSGLIEVIDLGSGQRRLLRGHANQIAGFALPQDGSTFASLGWDGTARVWDTALMPTTWSYAVPDAGKLTSTAGIAGSPERLTVVYALDDPTDVRDKSAVSEMFQGSIKHHDLPSLDTASVSAVSDDASILAGFGPISLRSGSHAVVVLDRLTGQLRHLPGPPNSFSCVAVTSTNQRLVAWSDDRGAASVINLENARITPLSYPSKAGLFPIKLSFSPDGKLLALVESVESGVRIFDTATETLARSLTLPNTGNNEALELLDLRWSADAQRMIALCTEGRVVWWDLRPGGGSGYWDGLHEAYYAVLVDDDRLAVVSETAVAIWSWSRREEIMRFPFRSETDLGFPVGVFDDGKVLAAASLNGTITLFDGRPRSDRAARMRDEARTAERGAKVADALWKRHAGDSATAAMALKASTDLAPAVRAHAMNDLLHRADAQRQGAGAATKPTTRSGG